MFDHKQRRQLAALLTSELGALTMAVCQELAEIGRVTETELGGDDRLLTALVAGCHVENAARAAGLSERTAYRRLADPDFKSKLTEARESLREAILARLADAGNDAIGKLWALMDSDDESIQLKAAKTLLDALATFHGKTPKENRDESQPGRVVLILPDDGRDPSTTAKIKQNGGELVV